MAGHPWERRPNRRPTGELQSSGTGPPKPFSSPAVVAWSRSRAVGLRLPSRRRRRVRPATPHRCFRHSPSSGPGSSATRRTVPATLADDRTQDGRDREHSGDRPRMDDSRPEQSEKRVACREPSTEPTLELLGSRRQHRRQSDGRVRAVFERIEKPRDRVVPELLRRCRESRNSSAGTRGASRDAPSGIAPRGSQAAANFPFSRGPRGAFRPATRSSDATPTSPLLRRATMGCALPHVGGGRDGQPRDRE